MKKTFSHFHILTFSQLLILLLFFSSCVQWAHDPYYSPPTDPDKKKEHDEKADSVRMAVACYNAGSGINSTPEIVAKFFSSYRFDVICFVEIPQNNWINRVGDILGMNYSFVGNISSANKKDKYKGILSRYPIRSENEYMLNSTGWNPASVVICEIEKNSTRFDIFCLQIAGSKGEKGSYAHIIADNIIRRNFSGRVIMAGDFDNIPDENAMELFKKEGMLNMWDLLDLNKSDYFTCCLGRDTLRGIVDHILFSSAAGSRILKGGLINIEEGLTEHKPVWAIIEFPPPVIKKKYR